MPQMPEHIHVDRSALTEAAEHHAQASDYLSSVPASHEQIAVSLQSLGPIYSEFREAAGALLAARKVCYEDQAAAHAEMADNLHLTAATWDDHEQRAATDFRRLTDGL